MQKNRLGRSACNCDCISLINQNIGCYFYFNPSLFLKNYHFLTGSSAMSEPCRKRHQEDYFSMSAMQQLMGVIQQLTFHLCRLVLPHPSTRPSLSGVSCPVALHVSTRPITTKYVCSHSPVRCAQHTPSPVHSTSRNRSQCTGSPRASPVPARRLSFD